MNKKIDNITIENARIMFRNFAGKEGKFNPAGKRNFCVCLDDEKLIENVVRDGWNVKYTKPRDPEDQAQAYIQVAVSYLHVPPKIWLISGKNKELLTEETVNMLDWAEIKNVDIIIRPYVYDVNGKEGVKAYVHTMYVTIEEDKFAEKYDMSNTPVPDDDDTPF